MTSFTATGLGFVAALAACTTGSSTNTGADAPSGTTITVMGAADAVASNQSLTALGGAALAPYTASGDSAGPATTSSSAGATVGVFTLNVKSPFTGYIKATATGYVDTYAWPPGTVSADLTGATIELITEDTLTSVYGADNCDVGGGQNAAEGVVALRVVAFSGATATPVAHATVTTSSAPADQKICYLAPDGADEQPSAAATQTDASGIVWILNSAVGSLTVTATAPGHTFMPTIVAPVATTFTTTLVAGS